MAAQLTVPKLGPEMESALLTEWLVAEGDVVESGQPVATVETDKVTTELEAPAAGAIGNLAACDEEYPVGAVLATIGDPSELEGADAARSDDRPAAQAPQPPADAPAAAAPGATPAPDVDRVALTVARRGEPLATPVARRVAQAHGIALADVASDAPNGLIRKRHVEAALAARAADGQPVAEAGTAAPAATGAAVDLSPMRRRIAARMHASLQETAQITDFREHDVGALVELRRAGVRWANALGFRVTFTDLFVRATALALREVPALNATLTPENRLIEHAQINIGVAVAIPDGLIVPVVHDAPALSLAELHHRLDDLVQRARAGRLELEQLSGGTFTVTNIGSYGSHLATPILVPGQVGIVGTGAFVEKPVVRDGRLAVGTTMYTSLTVDHRVIDGETAGRFQTVLGELLTDPERLL